jgi:hypothetical protein
MQLPYKLLRYVAYVSVGNQGIPEKYTKVKVKVKLSLCLTKHHAMRTYSGSRGTAPRILWSSYLSDVTQTVRGEGVFEKSISAKAGASHKRYSGTRVVKILTRGCIQKFPDWPPEAKTANGTALCY